MPTFALLLAGLFLAPPAPAGSALPDHADFTHLLSRIVQVPWVDYAALVEARSELDAYLDALARVEPAVLEEASRDAQLAFWINAYNACMLKVVADHYPIGRQRVGLFQRARIAVAGYPENSVWQIREVFTRAHCRIAGAARSQDEIEHEIIRPRFQEPRIHFAVNCAALSCPVLWPEAYTEAGLESQLERAVTALISSPAHFRVEPATAGSAATLRLNRVLDWYQEDFGGLEGLRTFFLPYLEGRHLEIVSDPATRISFFEYDWTLNDLPR